MFLRPNVDSSEAKIHSIVVKCTYRQRTLHKSVQRNEKKSMRGEGGSTSFLLEVDNKV